MNSAVVAAVFMLRTVAQILSLLLVVVRVYCVDFVHVLCFCVLSLFMLS